MPTSNTAPIKTPFSMSLDAMFVARFVAAALVRLPGATLLCNKSLVCHRPNARVYRDRVKVRVSILKGVGRPISHILKVGVEGLVISTNLLCLDRQTVTGCEKQQY